MRRTHRGPRRTFLLLAVLFARILGLDFDVFLKFAGLDVPGADAHGADAAVFVHNANFLEIGLPPALRDAGDILADTALAFRLTAADNAFAHLGAFPAVITYPRHVILPIRFRGDWGGFTGKASCGKPRRDVH